MYYAQPQPQPQQLTQAPPQNPATDILSTFMNIVPTVLTTISSTNAQPTIDIVDEEQFVKIDFMPYTITINISSCFTS